LPKFFLSFLLLLQACSHVDDVETKRRRADDNSSRFEWAVQHYEAGNYEKAIKSFEALRKEIPNVREYDLIPFYLGMSHYRLKHPDRAAPELEAFVRASTARQENQDARITLLLSYEKLGRWRDAASLAMETDKLTLFQYNRALLKLVWARALREQGELLGAKAALEEAQPFLDKVGDDDGGPAFFSDPDQDLWGRFHYTSILVQETECARLVPNEIGGSPSRVAKDGKKIPKRPGKRLYAPWLEAVVDCHRKSVTKASDELFERESPWSEPALEAIAGGISDLGEKTLTYLKEETSRLERRRALQGDARENLYRLLATIEEKLKKFKNQELNSQPLESLRKQVDRLLVQVSSP
jgi:tetratricopeptide (TPR) repeat protein